MLKSYELCEIIISLSFSFYSYFMMCIYMFMRLALRKQISQNSKSCLITQHLL